jgi:hypothetical protein
MRFFTVCALLLVLGCASARSAERSASPASQFPTRRELDDIGAAPLPKEDLGSGVAHVTSWDLTGPFPEVVGVVPRAQVTPWDGLLHQAAAAKPGLVVPTEDMHCVAREAGLFYLVHRGNLPDSLRRFVGARCGTTGHVNLAYSFSDIPDDVPEDKVFAQWKGSVAASLKENQEGGNLLTGIWFGRKAGFAVVAIAVGDRKIAVESFTPVPDDKGEVVIRGELLIPAESLRALINRGRFGMAECVLDPEPALPRFTVRCTPEPTDAGAWLEISAFPAGRVLGTSVLVAKVWPGRVPEASYQAPTYASPREVQSAAGMTTGLVELVNEVRKTANLLPVVLAAGQSQTASRLSTHFFAALFGQESEIVADKVVLGLQAGWDVEGTVRRGRFAYAVAAQTTDLDRLLAAALERPFGREVLLHPTIEQIAVGPAASKGGQVMAAVFATYELIGAETHASDEERLYQLLDEERTRRGRKPAKRVPELKEQAAEIARAVARGETSPLVARDRLMTRLSRFTESSVRGWLLEVGSLEELKFDPEVLALKDIAVVLSVSHYRPEGEPWGRYVVLCVMAEDW